ncbi:MAG: energy transducer TonB [Deltaproteobacteria bacterium]|nr:energy transducer TonB [Deltaproteobacteria bacterium]
MTTETKTTYRMVASGPAVLAREVERAEEAVEVVVMWGDSPLHVAHLSPSQPFYVGEEGQSGGAPDWLIGAETLGYHSLPVVLAGPSGPEVVVPEGADLIVTINDQTRRLAELEDAGLLSPSTEVQGARCYALPAGAVANVEHDGFTFVVRPTAAGKRVGMGLGQIVATMDRTPLRYIGGALAFFATMLAMTYFLPPAGAIAGIQDIRTDSRLVDYLVTAEELMDEPEAEWIDEQAGDEGGDGQRAADDEGQMGDEESPVTGDRSGIEGPADNEDVHMADRISTETVERSGILGVLSSLSGALNQPTDPFGRATAVGRDEYSALGAIMGDNIGNNFGFNGLGLTGTGHGGGGDGRGTYGLDRLGTIGRGAGCTGDDCGDGYGDSVALQNRRPANRVPRLIPGRPETLGALSSEAIRRVIHRHRNEVRHCYEQELISQPDLEGRVTVQFIISGSGAVQGSQVLSGRTNLGSSEVSTCVASAVRRWPFPQPENGGVVSVTYPFMFTSGN